MKFIFVFLCLFLYTSYIHLNKEVINGLFYNDISLPQDTSLYYLKDYNFRALNGEKFNFREVKGKVILFDFWATWCAPCRKEQPIVVSLINKINNPFFQVVSISIDKDVDVWEKYFRTNKWAGININIGLEEDNPLYNMISKSVKRSDGKIMTYTSVPQYYIMDKQLNIEKLEKIDTINVYNKILKKLQ